MYTLVIILGYNLFTIPNFANVAECNAAKTQVEESLRSYDSYALSCVYTGPTGLFR